MQLINGLHFRNLKGDIYGGVTAAVVALPLALAFGVTSGAGAIAGLYGAIFVGFFAALFGGTPGQVSGPTGPMTVVMAVIITQYAGNPAMAFTVVMMGGACQIVFGLARVGRFIDLVPYSVLSGFMSGIGCIIILLQIGPLLGHAAPSTTLGAVAEMPDYFSAPVMHAMAVAAVCLVIVFLTPKRVGAIVPPTLIALLAGTVLVAFWLGGASTIGAIPTGLPEPIVPMLTIDALPGMVRSALILGALGAIDSLLTSLVHDHATHTYHRPNRELIGQGIGNMVAGLFGGIPGAGATMRTMVNIRAGGRTPISGALHALILLGLVAGLAPLAAWIPHAVLAAILIKVGVDIIDWRFIRRLHRAPFDAVFKMLVVLALTVFVDLILAVAVGIVLAALLHINYMSKLQTSTLHITHNGHEAQLSEIEAQLVDTLHGELLLVQPDGPVTFVSATELARRVSQAEAYSVLVIDLSRVPRVDKSGAVALEDIIDTAAEDEKPVFVCGMTEEVSRTLDRLRILDKVRADPRSPDRLSILRQAAATLMEAG